MINIEVFSVGSHIASYVSCILHYFVDYGISLSQIKIVLFILANRECLIRRRRCINIVFIFAGQWKARVICGVLILENYPWLCIAFTIKILKQTIQSLSVYDKEHLYLNFLTKIFQKSSSIAHIYKTVIFPQIDRYIYSISQTRSQNFVPIIWHKSEIPLEFTRNGPSWVNGRGH
jgi:hypothetical protein